MRLARGLPAFSCAFAIAYLISMYFHPMFTLFTYAPRLGQWFAGAPAATGKMAPGMYWYSWLTTALIAGVAAGSLATLAPEGKPSRALSTLVWATPLVLVAILLYIERTWFGFK